MKIGEIFNLLLEEAEPRVVLKSKTAKGNRYFQMLKTGKFQHYDMPKGELSSFTQGEEDRKRLVSKLSKADKKTYNDWLKTSEGKESLKLFKGLKTAINESDEDIDWDLYELLDEVKYEIMENYLKAIKKEQPKDDKPLIARQPWEVIPYSTLERQWNEYMKWGFVKPNYEVTIEKMADLFTKNILKVKVNTEMVGHDTIDPKDEWREYLGEDASEEFIDYLDEHFGDYIEEPHGQYRISDYGLQPLLKLLIELRKTHDAGKKLGVMDRMLSVIHMRSDIAAWFVEGGTAALAKLSGNDRGN